MHIKSHLEAHAEKLRAQLAAIESCLVLLDEDKQPLPATADAPIFTRKRTRQNPLKAKGIRGKIQAVVGGISTDFTVADAMDAGARSGQHFTRAQTSQVVSRMGRTGDLEIVKPGAGRTPAIYRNKK